MFSSFSKSKKAHLFSPLARLCILRMEGKRRAFAASAVLAVLILKSVVAAAASATRRIVCKVGFFVDPYLWRKLLDDSKGKGNKHQDRTTVNLCINQMLNIHFPHEISLAYT